jgi:uncharacterized protein
MQIDITAAKKNPDKNYGFCLEYMPDNKLINNPLASFAGKAEFCGDYYYNDGDVYVKGKIRYKINYPCDRCSQNVRYNGLADFDDVFYGGDEGDYVFSGCTIDFTKAADDAIMLDIPHKILCGEDCKGLCPLCGKNLNEGECGCAAITEENPFGILKQIINKK